MFFFVKNLLLFLAASIIVLSAKAEDCSTVEITLFQGEPKQARELGRARPVATKQTVEEFYAYDGSSFRGNLPLGGSTSLILLHQDLDTCELSLVIVHSQPNAGNFLGVARTDMYITGDLWNPVVADDASGLLGGPPWEIDKYDELYLRRRGMTLIQWKFTVADTDGLAQPLPSPDWNGCIEVAANFYEVIDEWIFVSSDGSANGNVDLEIDEPLFVCVGDDMDMDNLDLKDEPEDSDPFPRDEENGYCERDVCNIHIWCSIARFLNCNWGFNITQP